MDPVENMKLAQIHIDSRKWAIENRKYVDILTVGDIVEAQRDIDPEGADVKEGDLGVVFLESNAYKDEFGPMVRWMRNSHDGVVAGGACNVYDGDVVKVS